MREARLARGGWLGTGARVPDAAIPPQAAMVDLSNDEEGKKSGAQ